MTLRRLRLAVAVSAAFVALGGVVQPAAAQVTTTSDFVPLDGQAGQGAVPNRLVGQYGIDENLGATVPTDLQFVDEAGRPVALSSLLDGERPVLLAFVYHNCPMLCSLVLDGVADAVSEAKATLGQDYEVLAVSIDPNDTPQKAAEAKARYVRQIDDPAAERALHFWTVTPETEANVERLAEAVGFRYGLDAKTGEYAHAASVMFLSPNGKITRYLYGLDYAPFDVNLAITEAGQGTVGSTLDRFLLTCFQYDHDAQSYSLAVLTATKIGGALLLLVFGAMLFVFWRREGRSTAERWGGVSSTPPGDPPLTHPGTTFPS
ncbi:SCO family protein [Rubrivirga sp. S365]|uniref:SCO family protein n=1 Tax=Rubrivirga litoralis TaxID=3075598 RepID=A0ABU3BPX2_9BACT|nr:MULTISPECIES: SCO family protein [unclassified Rubrivirga]MDT0631337.1 SCO family protein [Rubrivirga sp. F394]MDT7855928.1 SCO family protein [Rubrivirga sp. S365]